MKEIPLTRGQFAIVDDADFEWLNKWKWQAQKNATTYYAVRTDYSKGKRNPVLIYMHCEILGLIKDSAIEGDHRDRNGLNNQRNNLRLATRSQNCANRAVYKKCSSKYNGVGWHKVTNKWSAYIGKDNEQYHLGIFETEIEAAIAYNKAASELFGEFANLNKIDEESLLLYSGKSNSKKTSKYKGVSWCNDMKRWVAKTQINGKHKYLGSYTTEIEAALAYNNAHSGSKKKLNKVIEVNNIFE